ncbi:MAG: TonB C-terminal domain-containing protein [Myxococcota bacterium]
MQSRLVGAAFGRAAGGGTVVREAFPGMGLEASTSRAEALKSGSVSAVLHAALFLLLLWLAWMTPAIREEILPVQLIKEEPPKPVAKREEPKPEPVPEPAVEPAPAPKALAERRSMDFAPQAQAIAPQIVNPTVVAQASPQVNAQKIEMNQVAAVVAPQNITQATVVAERVTAVNSVAAAQTAKIDMGTAAAPALRGPANAALPAGPSVGPRQIVDSGSTVGTGTAVDMGSGSSVREGIASNRDVLGSPDGAPLANVATRVGDGFMRGDGGTGAGGGDTSDCLSRPEVMQYQEQVRQRMYARWVVPGDVPVNQKVQLRFALDASGSVMKTELVTSSDVALGQTAVDALRSAAPFASMPERVRCLARRTLIGTFSVPAVN